MANDYASKERRSVVLDALSQLDDDDIIVVLTLHHLMELFQHENDDTASERYQFMLYLGSRSRTGWIGAIDRKGFGSVVDVATAEADCLLQDPTRTPMDLVQPVRNRILKFGTPSSEEMNDPYNARDHLFVRVARRREIASLAHADRLQPSNEYVGELRTRAVRSAEEASKRLRLMEPELTSDLATRGDTRLVSPNGTATNFLNEVAAELSALSTQPTTVDEILALGGVNPREVPNTMRFSEAAYLAVQLTNAAELLGVSPERLAQLKPEQFPSWLLQHALRTRRLKAPRQAGSDLTDAHLATLVCYVDHTVVDRRTCEYLHQIKRHRDSVGLPMHGWSKVSRYEELPRTVRAVSS